MKKLLSVLLVALTASLLSAANPERPPLLVAGTVAPDFEALRPDGSAAKLSDFRGKVVLIDFWATWCGPCKETMPHMEKLHQRFAQQGLVVLGVCVSDTKVNFDKWQKTPQVPTTYLKVFDPRGREGPSIAKSLYSVSGIPTFYLVDREGKILHSGVGSGEETEAALNAALAAAGYKL